MRRAYQTPAAFSEWLKQELDRRDWTGAALTRRSGISTAGVSRILNNTKGVGPNIALAIAQALGKSPVEVFRRAGLLPTVPESPRREGEEIADLLGLLPPGTIRDEIVQGIHALIRHGLERTGVASRQRSTLDREAILDHFARRKGVDGYRATAHDERRLDQLEAYGYSQDEVIAAIDRAFDERPPDAPPIRMFSYCAAIALNKSGEAGNDETDHDNN